jgi:hypothetical protein
LPPVPPASSRFHSEVPWVLQRKKFLQIQALPLQLKKSALLAVNREPGTSHAICFFCGLEANSSKHSATRFIASPQ